MNINIPDNIRNIIKDKSFRTDSTGLSGSQVLIFDEMVLKIEPESFEHHNTVEVMEWLHGKLPVPEIIAYETDGRYGYLLMTRIKGKMACDSFYLKRPELLYRLLAEALEMLWSVDTNGCPRSITLESQLEEAKRNVSEGLVDMDNTEPDTFGENGFESPDALLKWLESNKPGTNELVLSHGDLCLPNIFFDDNGVSGFIDLGHTGVADKWRDIALCVRSAGHNLSGRYGGAVYGNFDETGFFSALGIKPDRQKINYYILMDELF